MNSLSRKYAFRTAVVFLLLLFPVFLPDTVYARFIDNGNGTVTDINTGYMWQRHAPDGQYTFDGARNYAGSLSLAGYHDWRVPDRDALLSIVDTRWHPSIVSGYFENTRSANYWTSTTVDPLASPDYAYVVSFDTGVDVQRSKNDTFYVRAVRDTSGDFYDGEYDDDDDPRAHIKCFIGSLSEGGQQ